MGARSRGYSLLLTGVLCALGCDSAAERPRAVPPAPAAAWPAELEPEEEVLEEPVALWENGAISRDIDGASAASRGYLVLDLGEAWTPYIFTDGTTADGKPLVNTYRQTYVKLARGDFSDRVDGRRARQDKYLGPYGILPSLTLLRERMQRIAGLQCAPLRDLAALDRASGATTWRARAPAARRRTLDAVRQRLECEGHLARGRAPTAARLRQALLEFEHRHHIEGDGRPTGDTLAAFALTPEELELRDLIRVLRERTMQAAGVLEDGSVSLASDGTPRTFTSADGHDLPLRDLSAEFERLLIASFGLETPEAALRWLNSLGGLGTDEHRWAAIAALPLPEYYADEMDLRVEIDRGDVWYDFPFDPEGRNVAQPVERRPTLTVLVRYLGQSIPLARYATTIGGWRLKQIGETLMWRYQGSPVGKRIWREIVAAPVWLPPETTNPKVLLRRTSGRAPETPYELNTDLTGPGYASALGLVAAYHHRMSRSAEAEPSTGYDEGIRTHSSIAMTRTPRSSNGCHRLQTPIAVRVMSFVLAHRTHRRMGQSAVAFRRSLQYEERGYDLELSQGGYSFELQPPLPVEVIEGRVRGKLKQPLDLDIPQYERVANMVAPKPNTPSS
jgi:hypothetical protein